MRTLNFKEIINLSVDEIISIKKAEVKEIEDYLLQDDVSEFGRESFLVHIESIKNEFNVLINLWEMSLDDVSNIKIDKLVELSKKLELPLKLIVKGGDYFTEEIKEKVDLLFKDETLIRFREINEYLLSINQSELLFIESDITSNNIWQLKHIETADSKIVKMCNVIKENELSPLEAIAFIHKIVTKSFLYKENEENPGLCRTIIGCLNTDNIVCVGYSHIVKALVDKLDYQRLKVDTVVFKIVTDDDLNSSISEFMSVGTPHMKNLVFISDEKYGVEGAYLLNATFDSKTKNYTQGRGFSQFMLPVEDIMHYLNMKNIQYKDSFDEFLGNLGIETYTPEIPPIIDDYKMVSKVISYDTLKSVIEKVLKIVFYINDEEKLIEKVEFEMDKSMMFSKELFSENAINSIRVEAEKYDFEE